jgi:hypothetical protein
LVVGFDVTSCKMFVLFIGGGFWGSTRPGLEPTIHRTRGEHANRYTNDAAMNNTNILQEVTSKPTTNKQHKHLTRSNIKTRWIVGSSPGRVEPKTMQLVFVASPLTTPHEGA